MSARESTVISMSVGLLLAVVVAPTALAGESEPVSISLVYMADLHAQLEPHAEFFRHEGKDETATAGGVARIATAVEAIRRERPGRVLFMDAGDTIHGSAAATWTEGKAVVAPVNALKLDLGIPGNWEVVYRARVLGERAGEFRHPTIAANLRDAKSKKLVFPHYLIKMVGGVRIGVIGFTDPDVPERQPPSYSKGLAYDGAEVLPPLIDEIRRKEKADVVVLLTHVGLPKSIRLAETLKGVDFALSGDTHERTCEPIVRGETWVVEPGSLGLFLGRAGPHRAGRQGRRSQVTARRVAGRSLLRGPAGQDGGGREPGPGEEQAHRGHRPYPAGPWTASCSTRCSNSTTC